MDARHGLHIRHRIPVRVKKYARVGILLEVQSHSTTPSAHEKKELVTVISIERVDQIVSLGPRCAAVEATVLPPPHARVIFEYIQNACELRKQDNPVSLLVEAAKKFVKDCQLSRCTN
jgi:hypothetical protein